MSMINVEITRNNNENSMSVIRRFSRKMIESGVIPKVKSKRYAQRQPNDFAKKTSALKRIARRQEVERLKKLGKM